METHIYKKRRQDLGAKFSRTLFVIPSAAESMRSHSVAYRHKTPGDFMYLSGVDIIDAVLVIVGKETYFLSDSFKGEASVWDDGGVLTKEDRTRLEGVKFETKMKLEDILRSHINDYDRIAMPVGRSKDVDLELLSVVSYDRRHRGRVSTVPLSVCDSRTLVGTLRLIKDESEVAFMQEAATRSSFVHKELMRQNFAGRSEKEVMMWIESNFMLQGMQWTAYETIVGSGMRSTILHARATDRILQEEEMLLIDAGGEWQGYCADITRAMPVGRKFSKEQKEVYNAVLGSQKTVLKAVKPGETLQGFNQLAQEVLIEGLLQLDYDKNLVKEDIKKLMPHSTSHWIGLDVHDPSPYFDDAGNPLKLEEGMSFTVEPGLYFREGMKVLPQYSGIGVRIEDDVLVTSTGGKILTSVPKEIEEIESLKSGS